MTRTRTCPPRNRTRTRTSWTRTPKDKDKDKDLNPKDQDKDKDLKKVLKESLRTRTRINIPGNSLFLNIDVTQINRLQAIQSALARAVTKTPKHHHITPVLKKLHWLKMPERIEYKAISLTYNTLQSSQPFYLRQLFTTQPSRSTRSSSALTLLRPSVTLSLKFADRSIAIAVPPRWNKLPPALRKSSDPSYELTKSPSLAISPQLSHSKLKTLLFNKSYPDSSSSPYLPPRLNSKHHPA